MNKYPEHEKMRAVQADSHTIGEFLDWLNENNMAVCDALPHGRLGIEYDRRKSIEQILADYFEIDLDKVSEEKDAMVAELYKSGEEANK